MAHSRVPDRHTPRWSLLGVQRGYQVHVFALARADPAWLGGLISRRVPLSSWPQALARQPGDVKVTVDLTK